MIYIADNQLAHAARTAHQEASLRAIPDLSTPTGRGWRNADTAPVCRTGAGNLINGPRSCRPGPQGLLSNFHAPSRRDQSYFSEV